jgi:hypothetical protein
MVSEVKKAVITVEMQNVISDFENRIYMRELTDSEIMFWMEGGNLNYGWFKETRDFVAEIASLVKKHMHRRLSHKEVVYYVVHLFWGDKPGITYRVLTELRNYDKQWRREEEHARHMRLRQSNGI